MVHGKWSLWWSQDLNPGPLGHESSALTTRPRLLASYKLNLTPKVSPLIVHPSLYQKWINQVQKIGSYSLFNSFKFKIIYFSFRPLTYRARRTTRKAALMIFSAWAISAIVWPPSIVAWPYIEGERTVPTNDCYVQVSFVLDSYRHWQTTREPSNNFQT